MLTLVAVHQLIEGFVWLGLGGPLSPQVTLDAGAYAAVASVIILAYFWRSKELRPFKYAESM